MLYERRHAQRRPVATNVHIDVGGIRKQARALNLSARGVFIAGQHPELATGTLVELVFHVPVQGLIRLHRKRAVVTHATARGVGMRMAALTPASPR
ncbi:PilZ domain-containing protein [Thioalkalivibrio sp. XN8]|uniref:PilZ domain-containing protein n=1 Tax=Thioalkalivibrio sp. XN8 TaxID=2712863 RepID=UPI0013EAE680|nr:PilZ domain-containing protein [Thioalkalivibrio sp. XN8]NGP53661.1 PilZ domain-containing protein [Thioalkalivibrio sp. XN8]